MKTSDYKEIAQKGENQALLSNIRSFLEVETTETTDIEVVAYNLWLYFDPNLWEITIAGPKSLDLKAKLKQYKGYEGI